MLSLSLWLYTALFECMYLISRSKKHMLTEAESSAFNALQWSVLGKLPSMLCCEASVVACLHASDWARVQTQSIVVLWWNQKWWGHSLWLLCLPFAMLCCMFLVLFTAFLTTWLRVNWATFGPGLMGENCIWDSYQKDCNFVLCCTKDLHKDGLDQRMAFTVIPYK